MGQIVDGARALDGIGRGLIARLLRVRGSMHGSCLGRARVGKCAEGGRLRTDASVRLAAALLSARCCVHSLALPASATTLSGLQPFKKTPSFFRKSYGNLHLSVRIRLQTSI